ncbi:unnamed protein product, partial [Meganyctiphanes norvegica]
MSDIEKTHSSRVVQKLTWRPWVTFEVNLICCPESFGCGFACMLTKAAAHDSGHCGKRKINSLCGLRNSTPLSQSPLPNIHTNIYSHNKPLKMVRCKIVLLMNIFASDPLTAGHLSVACSRSSFQNDVKSGTYSRTMDVDQKESNHRCRTGRRDYKIRPHLYTSLSSSLDEGPEDDDLGRIHFSLYYEASTSLFHVKVIEAHDLPRPSCKDKNDLSHSNPYVKVSLLPDAKNSFQTSVKKKTQDPYFDESFAFEVPYREVVRRTLELKVKDFDKYSRHCVVGHILLPLQEVNLARPCRMWQPLSTCTPESNELGELLVSLNYLPVARRLNVDIIKAKQVLQTRMARGADPYIRVSLVVAGRHLKSKKTKVCKNTLNPTFNEAFSFSLGPQELKESSMVFTAWDWNGGVMRDEFIGRVVIGKQPSGPHEITHWSNMMSSNRRAVAQWHSLHTKLQCNQIWISEI